MTDITVTIQANQQATSFVQVFPDPITIYNPDSTYTVWVGSNPSGIVGQGMPIGPRGTGQWADPNRTPYGVTDSPANITLSISASVSNLTNPVDIAVLTASRLLAQGIPNVLLQDVLVSLPGALVINAGQQLPYNSIGKYASLLVITNGVATNIAAQFDQASIWNGLDYMTTEWLTNIDGANSGPATWVIPVGAQTVVFSNPGVNNSNLLVYGTNRSVPKLTQLGKSALPRQFNNTTAIAVNATVQLTHADSLNDNTTRFNGNCRWSFNGNLAGTLQYRWLDAGNVVRTESLGAVAANVTTSGFFAHPNVPILWQFVNGATASATPNLTTTVSQA